MGSYDGRRADALAVPGYGPQSAGKTEKYYEKLRARIDAWLDDHVGPGYGLFRTLLFLIPDVFTLVFRLARDLRVSRANRLKLWGLAAYILSPVDINIDFILPFGPLDDLGLALIVLDSVLETTDMEILREHWPGQGSVIEHLQAATRALAALRRQKRRAR